MKNHAKNGLNWFIDIKKAPNLWYNKIATSNKPIIEEVLIL